MTRKMEKGLSILATEITLRVSLKKMLFVGQEHFIRIMVRLSKEFGKTIRLGNDKTDKLRFIHIAFKFHTLNHSSSGLNYLKISLKVQIIIEFVSCVKSFLKLERFLCDSNFQTFKFVIVVIYQTRLFKKGSKYSS
jgi:hypothetical protein